MIHNDQLLIITHTTYPRSFNSGADDTGSTKLEVTIVRHMANAMEIESSEAAHVPCDNCCGNMFDRLFLGNIMRPLFEQGDPQQVKDGLINFVTSSGVVSALFISISIEYAFGVEATNWASSLMAFMWYLSTFLSMWCVVVSTILGVLLSITPFNHIMTVGKKMLYAWTVPGWLMMSSSGCLVVAIWSRAEVDYIHVSKAVAVAASSNSTAIQSTQASLAFHALIVVWLARVGFIITVCSTSQLLSSYRSHHKINVSHSFRFFEDRQPGQRTT